MEPQKHCNRNPWYILMTLDGEQEKEDVDWARAKRNRRLWNAWACRGTKEWQKQIAADLELNLSDVRPNAETVDDLQQRYRSEWLRRNPGDDVPPPMPKQNEVVDFRDTQFDNIVLAARMYIPGLIADGANFDREVTFFNCIFEGPAVLTGARAAKAFDATGSVFRDEVHCDGVCFSDTCYWIGVKFEDAVNFNETQFDGQTSFGGVAFAQGGTISAAVFKNGADFSNLTTGGETSFMSTRFHAEADFQNATFAGKTDFDHCPFDGSTRFDTARFDGEVSFRKSQFNFSAIFSFVQFEQFADFYGAIFDTKSPDANQELTFANASFAAQVSFEDASFPSRMPVLSGAVLHGTTTLTVKKGHWPPVTGAVARRGNQDPVPAETTKASCARLRHVMGQQGFPEEEHFFFRREMHAAARAEPFYRTAHIYVYDLLSNFGYSVMRPLGWIALVWAIGTWVYATKAAMGWGTGAAYSFATMFKFFGFQRTFLQEETRKLDAIAWMEMFAAGQTVLAFVLLFFLGLGLRTRFRLR